MKFTEYKALELPKIAEEILNYWEENQIFQKSIDLRQAKPSFVFYEGPPSANGLPGIHHVMARAIKDIFCRYKTQKGFQVKRKAGWDTHGLPVELGVEKELGITKEDIGTKITVAQYNQACKKAVMRYTDIWNDLTKKIGYWVDTKNPYITYKSKYIESVWWLLKQIYDKGLLYKGYTIQPYSPKAGTGLSSHELNQPGTYQDISDTTIVAQFKAKKETLPGFLKTDADVYFLAWTTTPWTLPSNTALTVGKKIDYVLIQTFNQYTFQPIQVVLAKQLIDKQFSIKKFVKVKQKEQLSYKKEDKKIPFYIKKEFKGKDLVGIRYHQLLPYALPYQNPENAFRIIAGNFVTTQDGTGIVHTAPTFGADDAKAAKEANPEVPPMLVKDDNDQLVPLVDLQGRFRPEMGSLAGKYVRPEYYQDQNPDEKPVDVQIAIKLKEENKAFKVEKYLHSYPHCWRTDKPILYYPLDSWFIKVTALKERMVALNKTINWKPKATGSGRFGNWLATANDWNLSRSRFWGIPLPIWRTKDGKEELLIGSVEQLKSEIEKSVNAGLMPNNPFIDFEVGNNSDTNYDAIDLHKHIVDDIVLKSSLGQPMYRENDLIDVWFDSGAMPYAQWHYPFENKELIEGSTASDSYTEADKEGEIPSNSKVFPADFIAEGVDQTRGWFYTLHAIGAMVFDSVAFKNVVSNGLVLDKNGQKMSKRLGNAIDPFKTLTKYGPDATRWYIISNTNPWDNLKFDIEGIAELQRKFFGTLYNSYSFFSLYANIDGFDYSEVDIPIAERPEIDRWILSVMHSLIKDVDLSYAEYEPTKAARAISNFVQEHLSNWYVRLSRRRFWKGDYQVDKISAYQTLYQCLLTVAKLAAPIAPFYTDRLYQDLNKITAKETFESVHLSDFPKYDTKHIDKSLERKMENAQAISSLALSLRKKEKIKVRQPLQRIMIPVLNQQHQEDILAVENLIKSEVNVKKIELIDDTSDILVKQINPNYKVLGPKYGKQMGVIASEIKKLNPKDIKKIEQEECLSININGKSIKLDLNEVEISLKNIKGWLVASTPQLTVALDISITEALKKEGIARELVNRIQNLRKDAGFEITDKIDVFLQKDGAVEDAVISNLNYIKTETLATNFDLVKDVRNGIPIIFDKISTKLLIQKH